MICENIVLGAGTEFPLKGVLTLPDSSAGPVPAVVLVHGSGSSNMDEKVMKLTPFRDLAEGLAERGVASLRYDKRTFTHGLKMIRDKSTPITVKQETTCDAILAAELLRQDARIDSGRIYIIGHSMGGMLAPRIDAEGGNFAGLILLAGSPRPMEVILREQTAEMLECMPAFVRKMSQKKIDRLLAGFNGLYDMTDEEAKAKKYGGGVTMYYFKEMGEHPAPDYLAKSEKPMLVLQGEADFQVKADRDFRQYKELLGDRDNVVFRLYPGLNHCFVPTLGMNIANAKKEYSKERHIPAEVLDDVAEWIKQDQK